MVPFKLLRILLSAGLVATASITTTPGSVPASADTKNDMVTSTALAKSGLGVANAVEETASSIDPNTAWVDNDATASSIGAYSSKEVADSKISPESDAGSTGQQSTTSGSETIELQGGLSSALLGGDTTAHESKSTGTPTLFPHYESTHTTADASQRQSPSTTISLGDLLGSGSSGNILNEIEDLLKGVTGLLSPTLLSDLEEVVHDAATLLKGDTTTNTKSLLAAAYKLLNPNSANEIINAVHVAQRIVTPQAITELEEVNLAEVLKDIGTIYTKIKDFVENYKSYIPDNIVQDLTAILNNLTNLLDATTVKDIQGVISSIDDLLSPDVIDSLKSLLKSIGPLVNDIEPLISKAKKIITDIEPLWDKVEPYLSNVGSLLNEYLTSENIDKLGTLIDDIESIISTIAGVVNPTVFKNIESQTGSLFSSGTISKAKSLVSTVWGMLSVQGIENVGTLLGGLESLLTPTAVQDITNVGGLIGPYLTQASLNRVKSVFSTVSTYSAEIWDGAREVWDDAKGVWDEAGDVWDDASSYLKGNSSLNSTSLVSSSTITKAKSLISTTWGMISVKGIQNLGTLLGGLESLLTPTAVQDIQNIGGLLGPFLDQRHIQEFNSTISNISTYAVEVYNKTKKYWGSIVTPNLSEYITDAENVFEKVDILFTWIGPEITTQNLQKLSGFFGKVANDTSDVVDVVTGLINSNITEEVEAVVKSAEGLLTPKFFNEAASVLESVANV